MGCLFGENQIKTMGNIDDETLHIPAENPIIAMSPVVVVNTFHVTLVIPM